MTLTPSTIRAVALAALLVACGDDAPAADAGLPDAATDAGLDAGQDAGPPPEPRAASGPFVEYVNPLIGAGGIAYGTGSSSIAPQTPFGMARPGPDTANEGGAIQFNHCSGYSYEEDPYIWGFSQIRPHGMGVPDYGNVALMPTDGMTAAKTDQYGYRVEFDHADETVEVGYYDVTLADGIRAELTASERVAHHRYTFPATAEPTVIVDVGHVLSTPGLTITDAHVTVDLEAREIRGLSRVGGGYSDRFGGVRIYFVARFDQAFAVHGTFTDGVLAEGSTTAEGPDAGAYVTFADPDVGVQVGLSMVDEEHAAMNLDAETAPFDEVRAATVAAWEALLSRAEVTGRYEDDFVLFYSALYHALLMPTLASDVDGSYRGLDDLVHRTDDDGRDPFRYSTDFSLWDTFRTQTPLLAFLYPELLADQLRSLVRMARDGGYVPRWPLGHGYTGGMVGDSADLVFADALAKGVLPMAPGEAYAALRPTAFGPTDPASGYGGRRGIEAYMGLGYVPTDGFNSSASATLEFAYDDWGLAALAEAAGAADDAAALRERSGNWKNLWSPELELLVGRHSDGTFAEVERLTDWPDYYAEGNVRQYLWYVPHDLEGLIAQMGGWDVARVRLDEFFDDAEPTPTLPPAGYWQGNEPDIHAPWIYAAMDDPSTTAEHVRWVARHLYGTGPRGLPGNDDSGTMSAWLAFAMLGIYPITGESHYLLSAPFFTEVTLHLPGGDLVLDAPGSHDGSLTVDGFAFDGAPLERARVEHAALAGGGTLRTELR
ncbi:MAG: hypothetical protein CMN30_17035 [Sandaracinus sp.]|nr:hypothetical protein [Sandaracinus sp.]